MLHAKQPLIGLEVEFHLIDKEGFIVNDSKKILDDAQINDCIVPEISQSMIEVISQPKKTITELAKSFTQQLHLTRNIAKKYGLRLVPSSSVGFANLKKWPTVKFQNKEKIMGKDKLDITLHVCGTHVHVDKSDHIVKQHTVMTALDPLFTLMSSTPFFESQNNLNNYRVKVYRNGAYENFQAHGGLLPYVKTSQELQSRYFELYSKWVEQCTQANGDTSQYTKYNTCWGPIRFSQKTIESRVSDANLTSYVFALAAVFMGVNRQLEDIKEENGLYFIQGKQLPTFEQLKYFEEQGIQKGIEDVQLAQYLQQLISFAKKGLNDDEKVFLKPFETMLSSKKNFADKITDFAKSTGEYKDKQISQQGCNLVRSFIADNFEGDLDECLALCK
ncbi:MAG: glutamate-cysteine ligase family protein [Candidatus Woesearchaeota archaeon]